MIDLKFILTKCGNSHKKMHTLIKNQSIQNSVVIPEICIYKKK